MIAGPTEKMVVLCLFGAVEVKRYAQNDFAGIGSASSPFDFSDAD